MVPVEYVEDYARRLARVHSTIHTPPVNEQLRGEPDDTYTVLVTACCGRTLHELDANERISDDPTQTTCTGKAET